MPSIRVRFVTLAAQSADGARIVTGGRLELESRGAGQSKAAVGSAQPAVLEFHGRYLRLVREEKDKAFELVGTLEGKLELQPKTRRPKFTFGANPAITYVAPPPPEGEPFRQLRLDFDSESFAEIPTGEADACRFRLPPASVEPEDEPFFFELAIALKVAGAEEASLEVNDVLDVPLKPIRVGLVLELPNELDELVPAGLTLVATQGSLERRLDWAAGVVEEERRRFLFRSITGPAPVDLVAHAKGKVVTLWEQQDISNPDVPPQWKSTLEDAFRPPPAAAEGGQFASDEVLSSDVVPADERVPGEVPDTFAPQVA